MSIAVTDVDARVRQITRRDNTANLSTPDLAALILEACIDISRRLLNLDGEASGTLSAEGNTITVPSDMVTLDSALKTFYLGTTVPGSKLQDHITYAEWRADAIPGVAYYAGTFYLSPTDGNDRTYSLTYAKVHGALSTNLEFSDELKMAVVWLTAKKTYDNYFTEDSANQSNKAEKEYEREIHFNAPAEVTVATMRANSRM